MKIDTRNFLLIIILCIGFGVCIQAQDNRAKIKDFVDKEIQILDTFSGQSITLIKENREYFILRKFFGSGVPIIGTVKYKVDFNSPYQITFSEMIETSIDNDKLIKHEEFILSIADNGLKLYLNGLQVSIMNILTER
jgi:hypothetical protein